MKFSPVLQRNHQINSKSMMPVVGLGEKVHAAAPYAVMTLRYVSTAAMIAMLRSTMDKAHGVNSLVLVVYQQLASASVLVSLALLFDRVRRKPNLQILSMTCLLGFLQITVAEILLTTSLRYISATVQSVGLNIIPVLVFVLAVITGREKFAWGSVYGQAKLWSVFASAAGATLVALASDSESTVSVNGGVFHGFWASVVMVAVAVLSNSVACLLVERVAIEYSSDLTLSAMMNVFGMVFTVIVAVFMVRDSTSWKINTDSLELPVILFGGLVVTGVFFLGSNWCIHKNGPVFGAAFSPLLVVFSFIFDISLFQSKMNIERVIGVVLVVGGLYMLLWAKTRDHKKRVPINDHDGTLETSSTEPFIIVS